MIALYENTLRTTDINRWDRGENFPVASALVRTRFRKPIAAFYDFVRTADDIADDPTLSAPQKLDILEMLEATLLNPGGADRYSVGGRLAVILDEHLLSARHAQDLIAAFKLDVRKSRYDDWRELMAYCELSAMPVGRFVLDVHGESKSCWPASDAICAALQIINHLQDCKDDHDRLDRVYLPLDLIVKHGAAVSDLASDRASENLKSAIHEVAGRVLLLLKSGERLSREVRDWRLGLEIDVIGALAFRLASDLSDVADPFGQAPRLSRGRMARIGGLAIARHCLRRAWGPENGRMEVQ